MKVEIYIPVIRELLLGEDGIRLVVVILQCNNIYIWNVKDHQKR